MRNQSWAIFVKILFYFIWVIIFLHLIRGLSELINKDLEFWQRTIVSLQLTFEVIVLSQVNLLLNGIREVLLSEEDKLVLDDLREYPYVDIIIPTRRIIPNVLELTLQGFRRQTYPADKMKIYIADDTPEIESIEEIRVIAKKYDVNYISKPENISFKSGMLNLTLPYLTSDYVCFFDYDQIPAKNIVYKFIQIFQSKPNIDFIQAKKVFRDLNNIFKVWSALLYGLYFEIFERSKQLNDVVLFAGSTACFRRKAIDAVGGIPEDTFTEDNGLSVKLILNGSRGYYLTSMGSLGTVPPTFQLQIAQLWRWSNGASHVLKNNFKDLINSKNLRFEQKTDIIATFGISPLVVFIYVYGLSFIPLLNTEVDSARLVVFGISSIVLVPVFAAVTYTVLAAASIHLAQRDGTSEFRLSHLPGFLFIALASNILVLTSGLTGIFGKMGPNSKYGRWNRAVHIRSISIVSIIIGIILEYYAINWFLAGFASASLLIVLGLTLFPSFIVSLLVNTSSDQYNQNLFFR